MSVEHRAKNRGKGVEQARWLWLVYQRTGQKLRKYVLTRPGESFSRKLSRKREKHPWIIRLFSFALLSFSFFFFSLFSFFLFIIFFVLVSVFVVSVLAERVFARGERERELGRIQGKRCERIARRGSTISVLSGQWLIAMIAA